jgi:hypothetical protein
MPKTLCNENLRPEEERGSGIVPRKSQRESLTVAISTSWIRQDIIFFRFYQKQNDPAIWQQGLDLLGEEVILGKHNRMLRSNAKYFDLLRQSCDPAAVEKPLFSTAHTSGNRG